MMNSIIAKINGRNKVVDFRDGLVPAKIEDYAMLHGAGGKNHAPSSVIKLYICDYSAGTGAKSKTVHANISPELCEQIFEICKGNLGTMAVDNPFYTETRSALKKAAYVNEKLSKAADMQIGILGNILKVLDRVVTVSKEGGALNMASVAEGLSKLLTKTRDKALKTTTVEEAANPNGQIVMVPRHVDFTYSQDRVHNYASKTGGGDLAPVQRLQIWHTTYRKDGTLSNYPWGIKITNGRAKVKVQPTGATTFIASSMTNVEEAFINVSDADMFRAMSRVTHYVNVWENVIAAESVKEGREKRDAERKEWLAQTRGSQEQDDAAEAVEATAEPEGKEG